MVYWLLLDNTEDAPEGIFEKWEEDVVEWTSTKDIFYINPSSYLLSFNRRKMDE